MLSCVELCCVCGEGIVPMLGIDHESGELFGIVVVIRTEKVVPIWRFG